MPLPHEVTDNFVRLSQDNQVISKLDEELVTPYTFSKGGNMCMLLTNLRKGVNFFTVYYEGVGASDASDNTLINFPSEMPTDNLIIEYITNEEGIDGTTIIDSSGNGLDGTLVASPAIYGQAITFNGTSQYIDMPAHNYSGFLGFSVSIWGFDKREENNDGELFSVRDGSDENRICLRKGSYDTTRIYFLSQDKDMFSSIIRYWNWMHYTATVDASGIMRMYRDGILKETRTDGSFPNTITRLKNYIGWSYYGNISRPRIYDRALELDEIEILMKEGYSDTDLPVYNDLKFHKEEDGTWIIDQQSFIKRKKFTCVSEKNIPSAIVCIPRERFSAQKAIRVVKRKNNLSILPTISTAVASITSIQPKNGDFNLRNEAFNSEERLTGKIEKDGLDIASTSTAKIGFLANIQTQNVKILIDWIRARNFTRKEPIQLKKKDAGILITRLPTDWYYFDTTQSQAADKTSIDLSITNAPNNVGEVTKKKWLRFPESNSFNTNLPFNMTLHK